MNAPLRSVGPGLWPGDPGERLAADGLACQDEHAVVGGGIAGLYAALLLARAGRRVRVLERADELGGLAGSRSFRGVPCDLGSHRLHPSALSEPLFREIHAHEPFLTRPRRGLLLLGERRAPYPPGPLSMARALGARTTLAFGLGLLQSAARRRAFAGWEPARAARGDGEDVGFEAFVVARAGRAAYEAFYAPYARKIWGLHPAELSQTVAKKRLSTSRPLRLLAGKAVDAAARLAGRDGPTPGASERVDRFVYPAGGVGALCRYLERALGERGVPIERGRGYRLDPAGTATVLHSGDLGDLVPTTLAHRGLYLVWLCLPLASVGTAETYYAPDARCWFGRISELSRYSPSLGNPGESILCVEIPEGAWGPGVDFTAPGHLRELRRQLARARIVDAAVAPIEVAQQYLPRVYPLCRRGWLAEWRRAMARVTALGRVLPIGRQGLFLHCNLDHAAAIAADAVEHLAAGRSAADWCTRAERYVELCVRD